jgi:hypothetical protein
MDAEFCAMPAARTIPLKGPYDRNSFPGLDLPTLPGTPHTNLYYYRKLAEYEMAGGYSGPSVLW